MHFEVIFQRLPINFRSKWQLNFDALISLSHKVEIDVKGVMRRLYWHCCKYKMTIVWSVLFLVQLNPTGMFFDYYETLYIHVNNLKFSITIKNNARILNTVYHELNNVSYKREEGK